MNEPILSILCAAFNHEETIEQTLISFIEQKTKYQFEIVINDDSSTDATASIIDKYWKKYPTIIKPIFQMENQYSKGVDILKDILFPNAVGKYIAICEGDDFWCDNNKLEKQISFLESNNSYSASVHNTKIINENNRLLGFCYNGNERDILKMNGLMDFPHTSSYVFKNPYRDVNINYLNLLSIEKFWDKTLALFMIKAGKVHYFSDTMSCYRYITNKGSSFQTRMRLKNCTHMKIEAELQHYNQILNYNLNFNISKHYYRNVIDYSIMFFLSEPNVENCKYVLMSFKRSPFSIHGYLLYCLLTIPSKCFRLLKKLVRLLLIRLKIWKDHKYED